MGPELPASAPSPEACLQRFQETGDPRAFGALFDETAPELFRVALTLLPDAVGAEDAVQETYIGALGALERFEPGRRVMPWLVGILQHKLVDARRRRRRDSASGVPPVGEPTPEGSDRVESVEEAAGLHRAMEDLPEPYRAVAILRWRYGLEPAQIAHVRNEPPGTTRSLLSRAVERLRRSLKSAPALLFGAQRPRGSAAVRHAVVQRAARAIPISAGITVGGVVMSKQVIGVAAALLLLVGGWVASRSLLAPDDPPARPPASAPPIASVPLSEPPLLAPRPIEARPTEPVVAARPRVPEPDAATVNGNYTVDVEIRDVASEAPVSNVKVIGSWSEAVRASSLPAGAFGRSGSFGAGSEVRYVNHEVSGLAGADGRAVLRVEGPAGPLGNFHVAGDWHAVRWHRAGEPANQAIDSREGSTTKLTMWVRRAFRLQGLVVGSDGRPVPDVDINFLVPTQMGADLMLGNLTSRGGHDGRFDIGPFAEDPGAGLSAPQRAYLLTQGSGVTFRKEGLSVVVFDPRSVAKESRDRVTITLASGFTLAGTLVDGSGRALPNAVIAIEYGDEYDRRRGTRTDAGGNWRIDRLSAGSATLVARAFSADAKARRALTISADDLDVRIVAEPIRLSRPPPTTKVMGLELAEVDDDLRAAYDVPDFVHVLILDPGPEADPLGIGRLEKGTGIMVVGEETVHTVREVVEALLDETKTPNDSLPGHKRVVYTFWDERSAGTNTQHVQMTKERVAGLKATLERLPR